MNIKQALVIPDCHFPAVDQRAYDLMINVALDLKGLDEIVLLGDFADFYGVSSHAKDPNVNTNLMKEINIVNKKLDELDSLFPQQTKVFIEGNHEFRLVRYIRDKAPELFGMIDTVNLLHLDERPNWKFVPYGPHQLHQVANSKLYARHEPMGGSIHAAHNSVVKAGCSLIMGHNHRIQESQVVTINGSNLRGICTGWLGDQKHHSMQYVKNHHQWGMGFSVVDVLEDGTFFNNLIHIIDYKCSYGGYIYYG